MAAFFVCQSLLGDPSKASVKFKTVSEDVSSELTAPNPEVFNSTSINPTIEVYVGDCEDIDQNGILDDAELAACARVEQEENEEGNGEEVTPPEE